jgi:hypothetical protein
MERALNLRCGSKTTVSATNFSQSMPRVLFKRSDECYNTAGYIRHYSDFKFYFAQIYLLIFNSLLVLII